MGLNCSHGAFDGAYSAFDRFRRAVVEVFGGSWPPHRPPYEHLSPGDWYYPDDIDPSLKEGLKLFAQHSDCDGEFTPDECVKVARMMREAARLMREKEDIETQGHLKALGILMSDVCDRFAAGCEKAANAGECMEFR